MTAAPSLIDVLELFNAAKHGDLERVKARLERVDVNHAEGGMRDGTPLSCAAEGGHVEIVRLLLDAGAEPNRRGQLGMTTPLHLAARGGHAEVVRLLLDAGAGLDARDSYNDRTPVGVAAHEHHTGIVRLLLDRGADADQAGADGSTNLHAACAAGAWSFKPETVALLLERGATLHAIDAQGWTALHHAARWLSGSAIACLLERGADVHRRDAAGQTPLHLAAQAAVDHGAIPPLLAAGADRAARDNQGRTPFDLAARNAAIKAPALLTLKLDTSDVLSAIHDQVRSWALLDRDRLETVSALIDTTPGLSFAGLPWSPLTSFAAVGADVLLQRALTLGADPSSVDSLQRTPLHWAAQNGHVGAAGILLRADPALNAPDYSASTPLHLACRHGHLDLARQLLYAGADVTRVDKDGHPPAFYLDDDARAALSLTAAGEQRETSCPDRTRTPDACGACAFTPPDEPALGCPWCHKRALVESDYTVLHGNPFTPASDTEVEFTYTCRHCALVFRAASNAFYGKHASLWERGQSGHWSTTDGGLTWRRVY